MHVDNWYFIKYDNNALTFGIPVILKHLYTTYTPSLTDFQIQHVCSVIGYNM